MNRTQISSFVFFAAAITMTGCAAPRRATAPQWRPYRIIGVECPEPKKPMGVFTFTNTTGKPLRVSGFDSPDDGDFQIRFTEYQFLTSKGWQDLCVHDCGTDAQSFVLQPDRTYKIREWLVPFAGLSDYLGGATFGRVSLPTLSGRPRVWSEPFTIPVRRCTPLH